MHKLLARQFKRSLGVTGAGALDEALRSLCPDEQKREALRALAASVEEAYTQHDRDLDLSRRSLVLSSDEATVANDKLRRDAERTARVLASLRRTLDELVADPGESGPGAVERGAACSASWACRSTHATSVRNVSSSEPELHSKSPSEIGTHRPGWMVPRTRNVVSQCSSSSPRTTKSMQLICCDWSSPRGAIACSSWAKRDAPSRAGFTCPHSSNGRWATSSSTARQHELST